jgi:hypothetical protein
MNEQVHIVAALCPFIANFGIACCHISLQSLREFPLQWSALHLRPIQRTQISV